MRKRKIIFTTGIRSDFYIQAPIISSVNNHPDLECNLIVTGAHLSKHHGSTIDEIKKLKYKIIAEVKNLIFSDLLSSRVEGLANQLATIIEIFKKEKPDIVIAPYDREESMSVALAAVYMNIPVVHLGAGDRTRVNIDGIIRHSVSKLSHLFFVTTQENSDRLIKMGEEKWRVYNIGHSALDRYSKIPKLSRKKVGQILNLDIESNPLAVVLQHPVSNCVEKTEKHILETLCAVDQLNLPTVIIKPNSDPGSQKIKDAIDNFQFSNEKIKIFTNVEENLFVNIMIAANVLIGNSSMGILESPMLKLPVVNVGERQKDRLCAENVIFVPHVKSKIVEVVKKCLYNQNYKEVLKNLNNPYGNGNAGEKAANILANIKIDNKLLNKRITY